MPELWELQQKTEVTMTRDEQRKYKYVLDRAGLTQEYVDGVFTAIDQRMAEIDVGFRVYEQGFFPDELYPKTITAIVDAEMGMVETYEESINKTEVKCILDYVIDSIEIYSPISYRTRKEKHVK